MKRALYKGKFQPFHIGHLEIVKNMDRAPDIDELVIGIGSAQWSFKQRNPEVFWLDNMFAVEERIKIVEASLRGRLTKKFHLVPILDFLPKWGKDSAPQWLAYIKEHSPEFQVVYTNRGREIQLFSGAGYEIRANPLKYNFSATLVREKMALGDTWEPLVCPEAAAFIKTIGGEARACELFAKADIDPTDPALRWEWRTFDSVDEADLKTIFRLPYFRDEEVVDQYLFSLLRNTVNFKLRKGGFKIKKLMTRQPEGFEAWASFDTALPVERQWLLQGCRDIKFPAPQNLPDPVTEESLLETTREMNPYVFLFPIEKKRYMRLYQPSDKIRCGVDVTLFFLKGRRIVTVGLEAQSKSEVEITRECLGLKKYQPLNYLQFLERFTVKEAGHELWKRL